MTMALALAALALWWWQTRHRAARTALDRWAASRGYRVRRAQTIWWGAERAAFGHAGVRNTSGDVIMRVELNDRPLGGQATVLVRCRADWLGRPGQVDPDRDVRWESVPSRMQ